MRVLKRNNMVLGESFVTGGIDWDLVEQIILVAKNTRSLYNQMRSIRESLIKKARKGTKLDKYLLFKSSVIDTLVKETIKEMQKYSDEDLKKTISTATRNQVKMDLAEIILDDVKEKIGDL